MAHTVYEVVTEVRFRSFVRAADVHQAYAIARGGAGREFQGPNVIVQHVDLVPAQQQQIDEVEAGLIKSISYTCAHCAHTAHRDEWGPGWVTCPHCGEHPPTAACP